MRNYNSSGFFSRLKKRYLYVSLLRCVIFELLTVQMVIASHGKMETKSITSQSIFNVDFAISATY